MDEVTVLFRPVGQRHRVQTVGGAARQEYWIPAEELEELNRNIVGRIEVISEFATRNNDPTTGDE